MGLSYIQWDYCIKIQWDYCIYCIEILTFPFFCSTIVLLKGVIMGRKPREDGRNARTVANTAASAKKYDQIKIYVEKGQRDAVKAYAAAHGMSINTFINSYLSETIPGFIPVGSETGKE